MVYLKKVMNKFDKYIKDKNKKIIIKKLKTNILKKYYFK